MLPENYKNSTIKLGYKINKMLLGGYYGRIGS